MKQITIVTENRSGIVAEITSALAAKKINIENLDAESFHDSVIIILSVDRYDDALQVINKIPNLSAVTEDVILVRIEDKPGALAHIARRFHEANIDLRSIRIIRRDQQQSLVAICAERSSDAMSLVSDILVS